MKNTSPAGRTSAETAVRWSWQRGEKWHRLHAHFAGDEKPVTILRAAQNNGQLMTPTPRSAEDLIAAAPELLAAAKALRPFTHEIGMKKEPESDYERAILALEAAVAKAEGRRA